jgi:diguanylate cyclase (GGDEF)-like protein/PAS domain S-box-containing protein
MAQLNFDDLPYLEKARHFHVPAGLLEQFAPDEDVGILEATLVALQGEGRLAALVPLAWNLRQRDCSRALALADEAEAWLDDAGSDPVQRSRVMARLTLVRGEIKALFADLGAAEQLANAGIARFEQLKDPVGTGDGRWLLASIWHDRGDREAVERCLGLALRDYRLAGDSLRVDATVARALSYSAFRDAASAASGIAKRFAVGTPLHDAVLTWVAVARANVAALTDDPGAAIKQDLQAYHAAGKTGQVRQALTCAVNTADGFSTLGDLDAALEWSERALALARVTNWPGSIGVCLKQMGEVLRPLKRPEEARAFLREAYEVMEALAGSRNREAILEGLGQNAIDLGNFEEALDWFARFERWAATQGDPDLLIKLWRGQAIALSRLGRPDDAIAKANEALQLARDKTHADEQVQSLRVLAEIHRDHDLPNPPGMTAPSAALHFLGEALRVAHEISGYSIPAGLLHQVASAYAACNDYRAAYENVLAATAARNKTRIEEAEKRALAMQIRHEIDRARADTEHLTKLAGALQETNSTLETLGMIGQEITGSLDTDHVFEALHRHADQLLDVASFVIYLLDEKGETLTLTFGREAGEPHPAEHIPVDHPHSYAARCARERRELVINEGPEHEGVRRLPGTLDKMSFLFAPLEVGKRLLGVMSIQSMRAHAYGERECSIFRTLSAYGAIALDNSAAYGAVEAARRQTASQEQELRVAAAAFESQEGLIITDANLVILRVNGAFINIVGYPAEEVVGQDPGMFRSMRNGVDAYAEMRQAVLKTGTWQGELWTRRKNGETFPLWLTVTAVYSADGDVTHYVFALVDITERKVAEDEIRNLAFYDPLTNLPNRRLLMDRLRHALATSARTAGQGALLFVDLDNFKKLNDTRGHDVGDLLLAQVAERLVRCLRDSDTVARLGGDEFVVLLEGLAATPIEAAERVETVSNKILATLNEPYLLDGKQEHSTPSIGVCFFQGQGVTVDDLLKQADLAMYQAKASGRNAIRFFDPKMQAVVSAHAALEADLRLALIEGQFILHYQNQVDRSGNVTGAEALVRWNHPERGMVSPGEFIPLAEETGLILPLGLWVLETACTQLRQWATEPETAHLKLAVNISVRQFHDVHFVDQVLDTLERTGADPRKLKLELTESLLLRDVDGVIAKMNILMAKGVSFSLDDFGTGYSSLSYLKRLPLEQLKIDQSFVRDIFVDSNDVAIVRAIVTLGQSLGLSVIAEGVETEDQRKFLEASGCHAFQGFLFGRPGPADSLMVTP